MEILIIGAVRGALYSLLAVGFILIFSVGGILNLAHGTFYMLGAYMTFILYSLVFGGGGVSVLVSSTILAVLIVGLFGSLVYYILLRKNINSFVYLMVITLGLSLFVGELMSLLFGVTGTNVPSMIGGATNIMGVQVMNQQLLIIPIAVVVLILLWFWLKRTKMGQGIDAMAQQQTGAVLMGVSVERSLFITSGVAAALAALAGALIAPVSAVVPEMHWFPLMKAFAIAILGGIGSLMGGLIASFVIAYAEVITSFLLGDQVTELVALVVIVLVLIFKPSGIMGFKLK